MTRVSRESRDYVQALEAALAQMHAAELQEEVEAAYSLVSLCRQSLYQYIERIETQARVPDRSVVMRF